MADPCLHCEQAPQETYLRLCRRCASVRGLRRVYKRTARWTPERDARIQALVERAKRQLPLFDDAVAIAEITTKNHLEDTTDETRPVASSSLGG